MSTNSTGNIVFCPENDVRLTQALSRVPTAVEDNDVWRILSADQGGWWLFNYITTVPAMQTGHSLCRIRQEQLVRSSVLHVG